MLKKILCILLLGSMIFLCACSQGETPDAGTVNFTDALGREVKVSKNPKRVAALLGSFADIWLLAGGEICATADDAWEDFGLFLDGAVNIGGAHSPSLELLISAGVAFALVWLLWIPTSSSQALRPPPTWK